jgi:hypothetical protein
VTKTHPPAERAPAQPVEIDRIEIYVRFLDPRSGRAGVFETPCDSVAEAAGQFAQDPDCVSAMKVGISAKGRPVAMSDATDQVKAALIEMVREGRFEACPHPIVEDVFDDLMEEARQAAEEDAEHERIESAMLHI